MKVTIVVAYDEDRAIAKDGSIPWHIAEDFKHFKTTTLGCPVVMGRKTWDSLPKKPLPDRTNIVISTQRFYTQLALMVRDLDEAIKAAERHCPGKEIFVIGGLQIYEKALASGMVDRVVTSHIKGRFGGDLFFPELPGWTRRLLKSYDEFEVWEWTESKA